MEIWIELVEYIEMKAMEETLRETYVKAQQDSERINALPPAECMTTIFSQRKSYMEVE
jgi:hypothetical protein